MNDIIIRSNYLAWYICPLCDEIRYIRMFVGVVAVAWLASSTSETYTAAVERVRSRFIVQANLNREQSDSTVRE